MFMVVSHNITLICHLLKFAPVKGAGFNVSINPVYHPYRKMMGYYLGSCRRILDEARIHKYTHINHKLNTLNIKYYKFSSSFDTQSFAAEITHRCRSDTLDDTIAAHCPKMPPSEMVNAYGLLVWDLTVESGPLTGSRPRHQQKEEKNYLHTVRSTKQSVRK
jgi:hypothetical protein